MDEWEDLIVTFDWHRDRPRYANDVEIARWTTQDLAALMAEWRAQGWELVAPIPPPYPGRFLRFRRSRASPGAAS
jgi:hypothetical protein